MGGIEIENPDLQLIQTATDEAARILADYKVFKVKKVELDEENKIWTVFINCGHGDIEVECAIDPVDNVLGCWLSLW